MIPHLRPIAGCMRALEMLIICGVYRHRRTVHYDHNARWGGRRCDTGLGMARQVAVSRWSTVKGSRRLPIVVNQESLYDLGEPWR